MGLALLFYHSLAGGTLLAPDPYDSYLLQAKNWLAGRIDIAGGEGYPWLELAIYQGKYYLSFPPVPSVLALPLAAAGLELSGLAQALAALWVFAGVYLCFWQQGHRPEHCLYWAVFTGMGSGAFWLSCKGEVWFTAQLLGLGFVVWGSFFWLRRRWALSFFLLALAVGCRPFSVLPALMLYLPAAVEQARNRQFGALLRSTLPPAAVAAALGGYNLVRFGSVFEFGRRYLPEFVNAPNGQFSPVYFWHNLKSVFRPVVLNSALDLEFPIFEGFLFFVANPIFLYWFLSLIRAAREKRFGRADALLLAGFCAGLFALCLHRTMGG